MEYAAEALSDETSEITPNDLAGDYACIAEIIGIENTILLHKHYRGQQITLPQRLYSVQYVVKEVERQLGTHYDVDLLFFSFYCFSYSFNHLLVYAQEDERNEKAISFCCMGRRHFNNSPICSRLHSPGGQSG